MPTGPLNPASRETPASSPPRLPSGDQVAALPVFITINPGDGITVTSSGNFFRFTFANGFVQWLDTVQVSPARPVTAAGTNVATNAASIARADFYFLGHLLAPSFPFFVVLSYAPLELDPTSSYSPLADCWVGFTRLRDLNLRVGQIRVPLNQPMAPSRYIFVDDVPVLSELGTSHGTDVGMMLFSTDLFGLKERLRYAIYAGTGEGQDPTTFNGGFLVTARLRYNPFGRVDDDGQSDFLRVGPRLAIGIAGGYHYNSLLDRSSFGRRYQLGGFDYRHFTADVVFKMRGLSILSAVIGRDASTLSHMGRVNGLYVQEFSRSAWGFYFMAAFMFPRLVEIAARFSRLMLYRSTDPALERTIHRQGQDLAASLSWYVYAGRAPFKIMTDYSYAFGDDFMAGRHQIRFMVQTGF